MSMQWFRILDLSCKGLWCQDELKESTQTPVKCKLSLFFGMASGDFLPNGRIQTSRYINLVGKRFFSPLLRRPHYEAHLASGLFDHITIKIM